MEIRTLAIILKMGKVKYTAKKTKRLILILDNWISFGGHLAKFKKVWFLKCRVVISLFEANPSSSSSVTVCMCYLVWYVKIYWSKKPIKLMIYFIHRSNTIGSCWRELLRWCTFPTNGWSLSLRRPPKSIDRYIAVSERSCVCTFSCCGSVWLCWGLLLVP